MVAKAAMSDADKQAQAPIAQLLGGHMQGLAASGAAAAEGAAAEEVAVWLCVGDRELESGGFPPTPPLFSFRLLRGVHGVVILGGRSLRRNQIGFRSAGQRRQTTYMTEAARTT